MMNDETEPFERRLSQQPLRPAPADWRADILRAAQAAGKAQPVMASQSSWFSVTCRQMATLLWPNSKAWVGVAMAWMLIVAAKFSMRDTTPLAVEKQVPPSPTMMVEWHKQQRLLAELSGSTESPEADRPKKNPAKPRSEHTEFKTL